MALIANNISGSINNLSKIGITGSVVFASRPDSSFPILPSDTIFYVSGSKGTVDKAVFHGDVILSGTTYIGTAEAGGSLQVTGQDGIVMNPYGAAAGQTSEIKFKELVANGVSHVALKAPNSLAASLSFVLPSADGSANHVIKTDGMGNLSFAAASTLITPGGSDTYVQFNDGGSTFGGDAGLTYNKTTDSLTITGDLAVNGGDVTSTAAAFNLPDGPSAINIGVSKYQTRTIKIGTQDSGLGVPPADPAYVYIGDTTSDSLTRIEGGSQGITLTGGSSGPVSINTSATTATITAGGTGQTGTIEIGRSIATNEIKIGASSTPVGTGLGTDYQTINIGTGTGRNVITIGSDGANSLAGSSLALIAGSGHMVLSGSTTTNYTMGGETGEGEIKIGRSTSTNSIKIGNENIASSKTQTIAIGAGAATAGGIVSIAIGSTVRDCNTMIQAGNPVSNASAGLYLTGSVSTNYYVGGETALGTITIGRSTDTNTIDIGNAATATSKTQTINIGASSTSTGRASITIGSATAFSSTTIRGGRSGITLETMSTNSGDITLSTAGGGGAITIGNSSNGSVGINTSATTATITLGGTSQTAAITVGRSTQANTIDIGNAILAASQTQAINIGANASSSGKVDLTMGSTIDFSATIIRGGRTNGIKLETPASVAGPILLTTSNGGGAITIGDSTVANTINIGASGNNTANTQTIGIGSGTGRSAVTIGSLQGTSSTIIQGGQSNGILLDASTGNGPISLRAGNSNIVLGSGTSTGTIYLSQSANSNTIEIGSTKTTTGNTLTVNVGYVGAAAADMGTQNITIGKYNTTSGLVRVLIGGDQLGFFQQTTAQSRQTSGANLTNNVTSGGVDDTIANFTDLLTYSNSAGTIRNNIYQLARKVKQINDALRLYGLLS